MLNISKVIDRTKANIIFGCTGGSDFETDNFVTDTPSRIQKWYVSNTFYCLSLNFCHNDGVKVFFTFPAPQTCQECVKGKKIHFTVIIFVFSLMFLLKKCKIWRISYFSHVFISRVLCLYLWQTHQTELNVCSGKNKWGKEFEEH